MFVLAGGEGQRGSGTKKKDRSQQAACDGSELELFHGRISFLIIICFPLQSLFDEDGFRLAGDDAECFLAGEETLSLAFAERSTWEPFCSMRTLVVEI